MPEVAYQMQPFFIWAWDKQFKNDEIKTSVN